MNTGEEPSTACRRVDTEIETWRALKESLRAALKEPGRTDFVPRLRVAAEARTAPAYAAI